MLSVYPKRGFVSDVSNMSIMCESFNLFRSDRSGRGGGVAIYINKKLNAKKVCVQPETSAIEYIFLSIFNKRENTSILISLQSFSIFVTCSYIPPGSDLIIYEHHLSAIKSVLSLLSNSDLLIVLW